MFRKTLRKVLRTYIRPPRPYTRGRKVLRLTADQIVETKLVSVCREKTKL